MSDKAGGSPDARIARIVTGGQTGVDRAALDFAIAAGIPYGGWCPKGGWAEDMPEPPGLLGPYPGLRETPDADTAQRTAWNVRDSDVVLVLGCGHARSQGSDLALRTARELGRPHATVDLAEPDELLLDQLIGTAGRPLVLGIGGPRESEAPGIYALARAFLERAPAPPRD